MEIITSECFLFRFPKKQIKIFLRSILSFSSEAVILSYEWI